MYEPDRKGAEELEQRRLSELAEQQAAVEGGKSGSSGWDGSPEPGRTAADEAKDNEQRDLESGKELPA